jgi:hypothetical protein
MTEIDRPVLMTTCPGEADYFGHCPACHRPVLSDEDFPVWICPHNLSEGNPHREDAGAVSEIEQEAAEVYSRCPADHVGYCYQSHMPLHGACYDQGKY